ncbi:MAG: PP2C family protein-serine/threonine phosphatase [Clostridia bacterium]|nr:PP2C family protein-serine/threonine phosphatase [Clostridia bacterium]
MNFDISMGNLINVFMIAAGIGISGLSIVQISKAPIRKQVRKYLIFFSWMIIGYVTMHLTRQMLEGRVGTGFSIAIRTVTFIEFLISGIMAFLLSMMILYISSPGKSGRGIAIVLLSLLAVHSVLLIVSQFTDLYYFFDENNVYHRSSLYLVSNLTPVLMLLQDMYLLVRYRKKFARRVLVAFWIYIIAPLFALVLQAIFSEVQFVIFGTVGAAVNMFAAITRDLTEKYEQQQIDASRIDAELSMATRIQADMLPSIFPAFPERSEFDIYASMKPAKEVGGDFYDFFFIDENTLGIVIADVSGKGVPAALFMMASKILVQNYALMKKNPSAALEAANNQICQSNREQMFVTVWLGILDLRTGILTASNAGHEYPIIKSPGGKFELYKDKHGFVIGGMEDVKYKEYQIQLEKGSMLFIYTDGVAEASNSEEELFGTDRMLEALNGAEYDAPMDVLGGVNAAVEAFVKDAPQFDDLTMLCLKYNGAENKEQ